MSRRDYEEIAASLAASKPARFDDAMFLAVWECCVEHVALGLQRASAKGKNTRFDKTRFLIACTYNGPQLAPEPKQ